MELRNRLQSVTFMSIQSRRKSQDGGVANCVNAASPPHVAVKRLGTSSASFSK